MKHLDTVKLILGDPPGGVRSCLIARVPERDSMAVTGVICALKDHVGVGVEDDDVNARRFATVGSLTGFVQEMLQP